MTPRPLQRELVNPAQHWWTALDLGREESALAALRSEAAQGRAPRSVYDLFQEMEDKDGHLYAVLQTRKNGVLARDRRVVPHDDSRDALEAAKRVECVLRDIPDFEQSLLALLDGIAKGFSVVEILWGVPSNGTVGVVALRGRPQTLFAFSPDHTLRMLRPVSTPEGRRIPGATHAESEVYILPHPGSGSVLTPSVPAPPGKFLVLTFGSSHSSPYGKGLCLKCYWYAWFKKNNLKFWAIYNERFGAPAVLGKYAPGTTDDERQRLMEVIESLQSDSGVTLPEGMALEFLEARRSGDGATYRDFADWCNDEISKIVLGATLVASEGRRSGSLALGEVHQRVRSEYVESDAKILMEVINRQLIPWIVWFNLGMDAPLPRWEIDTHPEENLKDETEVDRALVNLGVPLPLSHFYEHYRRPVPQAGEKTLRFDDTNLYQYHLQFGVLTINEVRSSLGLPPVPWGDTPPKAMIPEGDATSLSSHGSGIDAASSPEDTAEPRERENKESIRES